MNLAKRDHRYIWHPYTQEGTAPLNIPVVKGKGAWLYTEKGDKYLDGISSWWTNIHGHAHPYIAKKIAEQANTLEQVIFAGFTHPKAVELGERLISILPVNQKKIFYSDNGSTAVEVALKMAFQYWQNRQQEKTIVLALEGAYHGDTFGSMSVSERGLFTKPFFPFLFEVIHIPFPEERNELKSLKFLQSKIKNLASGRLGQKSKIASFIFEPLIQGAAGMRPYPAGVLDEMIRICRKNNIITIADEVMTGFGRTGKMFACDHLTVKPDIMCLSKGITGGFMPLGATTCTEEIYNAFLESSSQKALINKTFFHGHSYTANPLACAAACASLDLFEKKSTWKNIRRIEKKQRWFAEEIKNTRTVQSARALGTIISIELKSPGQTSYLNELRNKIYNFFISEKIVLRPLGNIIYVMPPYCISGRELDKIYIAIKKFLHQDENRKYREVKLAIASKPRKK